MAGIGRHAHHDPVRQHRGAAGHSRAVAARLANDRGGLARDGALVHRGGAHDDLAIGGDLLVRRNEEQILLLEDGRVHLFGLDAEELSRVVGMRALGHEALVELVGHHVALGGAQGVGLRFAAALGDGFREVREQHRKPQHHRNGDDESGLRVGDAEQRQHEQGERQDGRNVDHEHDGVLGLLARLQLHERIEHRALGKRAHCHVFHRSSRHLSLTCLPTAPSSDARRPDPAQARGTS